MYAGVMALAVIRFSSRSHLLFIQENMTAERYVKYMLKSTLLPYIDGHPYAHIRQDNARSHIAYQTTNIL